MLHIRHPGPGGDAASYSDSDSDSENEERKNSNEEQKESRVILLLDLDCFEVQVLGKTEYRNCYFSDQPAVAVNHDHVILSVNYAAKRLGVKRSDTVNSAREKCPQNLQVLKTGTRYGKSDSFTPYQESDNILETILEYQDNHPSIIINRASKDEFYFDVTAEVENRMMAQEQFPFLPPQRDVFSLSQEVKGRLDSHYKRKLMTVMEGKERLISGDSLSYRILQVYGNPQTTRPYHRDEIRLVFGAIIASEIIVDIYERSGSYVASVGVAHNKLRAKLASDLNKPEGICILTDIGFQRLARTRFTISHLPGFGGTEGLKFEQALKNHFGCKAVSLTRVQSLSLETLSSIYERAGIKLMGDGDSAVLSLLEKSQGTDNSIVTPKLHNDSLSTSTTFKYCSDPIEFDQLVHLLCCDMRDRLEYIQRRFNRQATTVSLKLKVRLPSGSQHQKVNGNERNSGNGAGGPTQICIRGNRLPDVNEMENLIYKSVDDSHSPPPYIHKITLTANQIYQINTN